MRIAIAGATGNLGQQVVPRLLERGLALLDPVEILQPFSPGRVQSVQD